MPEAKIKALRPATTGDSPCKICGAGTAPFGVVDFHKSCEEAHGRFLPSSAIPVHYRRCTACGFLFTDGFDDWTEADFKGYIYNENYLAIDPEYSLLRPAQTARALADMFDKDKGRLRVLDYGGGDGTAARLLLHAGFAAAQTYDVLTPPYDRLPEGRFEIVSCVETLEHLPDPLTGIAEICRLVAEPGLAILSTLIQPADIERQKTNWWYLAPRNGHISLFSQRALALAFERNGFRLHSFNDATHAAFRHVPDFARHLIPGC